jgi:hypothetical protein
MNSQLQASLGRPQYMGVQGINHSIQLLARKLKRRIFDENHE